MGIYKRPDSPLLWYSITLDGHRFRGCCGTAARDAAKRVVTAKTAELRARLGTPGRRQLSLAAAFTRYADEHAMRLASAGDIARIGETVIGGLGGERVLSGLLPGAIATFVARRRALVSDSSVNRELTILRAVLRMAAERWGVAVARIDWKKQFLVEPAPRSRVLSAAEEERLFLALRPDFRAVIAFALATGMRRANAFRLRWSEVDLAAGTLRIRQKSRRPGGDHHVVPITREVAAILAGERGRHPEFVFTYVPRRARSAARLAREAAGRDPQAIRLPFTRDGWRKAWQAALTTAAIDDFRLHDLRHTRATRLYLTTGNLRLVQKLLGHKSIETTLRYENSGIDDLRAALEDGAAPDRRVTRRRVTKPR